MPAGVRVSDLAKNLLAPAAKRSRPRRGSLGMDGDARAVIGTLDWLGSALPDASGIAGANVLEVGPGRTPDLLAAFVYMGASGGIGVDVEVQVGGNAAAPPRYAELRACLSDPANASVLRRWGTTGEGVHAREGLLGGRELPLRFVRAQGDALPVPPGSVDLIVSKSVLEHVELAKVPGLLRSMRVALRPAGMMVHVADLRDHLHINGDWSEHGNWLEALTHSPRAYAAMFSRRSSYINRLRGSEWRTLLDDARFDILTWNERRRPLPLDLDREALHPPWRDMSDEQLCVGHVAFAARPRTD